MVMMKILITCIGTWLDKGEAAMLISMKIALQQRISDLSITASASSFRPNDIDKIKYGEYGFKILPGLFPAFLSNVPKIGFQRNNFIKTTIVLLIILVQVIGNIIWSLLYIIFRRDIQFLISNSSKNIVKEYRDADCVIICGGQNVTNFGPVLLIALYEIILSKMLGKTVMIWANSLGPFNPKYIRSFVKSVLNRVDLITTREASSKKHLDLIGVSAPSFVTADAAFILPAISPEEALLLIKREMALPENRIKVGITVINWGFPGYKYSNEKFEAYLIAIAGAVDYIIDKFDAFVFFFPQVIIPNVKDDRQVSTSVLNKVKNKSRVAVLTKDYSPEQLKGMYGCMSLLIGTRFHSCIFAQSMHVPTIAIEYDGHKALGIMKLLELEEYVCDISNISAQEIISKVEKICDNRTEVKQKLEKNIRLMQDKSMENLYLAMKYDIFKEQKIIQEE